MEKTNILNSLFPIQMNLHVFLALLSLLVFGMQFIRYRKKHHFILTFVGPCTLLPYLAPSNMTLFHAVGVVEFLAFLLALILTLTVDKEKKPVKISEAEQKNGNAQVQEQQEENL